MKWITREKLKIDRIACPWLIKNFVDKDAEFIYAPVDEVKERAKKLSQLTEIVRGAYTDYFELAQQSAGLWAISAGLSYNFKKDHQQLETGMILYDALYSWAKFAQSEVHMWNNKL